MSEKDKKQITRRNYLKYAGAGVVVVGAAAAAAYYSTLPTPGTTTPVTTVATTPVTTVATTPVTTVATTARETVVLTGNPEIATKFDPMAVMLLEDRILINACYEPLVRYSSDKLTVDTLEGALAESWEASSDCKTWVFNLRKNVKFHDGSPFTAKDVKATYDRVRKLVLGNSWYITETVESYDIVDDHTFQFNLKAVTNPDWVVGLCWPYPNGIISANAIEQHQKNADEMAQEWLNTHEAGTGPYMVDKFVPGERIEYVKFKDYWRGWSGKHVDRYVHYKVKEIATGRMMLERGDMDIWYFMPWEDFDALKNEPGIVAKEYPYLVTWNIQVNVGKDPTNKKALREAMAWGIDYDAVVNDLLRGHGYRSAGLAPRGTPNYDESLRKYSYDPAKAADKLEEAGYPKGKGLRPLKFMVAPVIEKHRLFGELFKSNMADLGVQINLEVATWPAWFELYAQPDPNKAADVIPFWITADVNANAVELPMYRHTFSKAGADVGGGNWMYYKSAEQDRLIQAALHESDPAKLKQLRYELQAHLIEDLPMIHLWGENMGVLMKPRVKNYWYNSMFDYSIGDAWAHWNLFVEA